MAIINSPSGGGFWDTLGQSFVQSMMRQQQLQLAEQEMKLRKDQLKLQQDEAARAAEERAGRDQAGANIAMWLAANDPQAAQIIQGMQASPQQMQQAVSKPGAIDPNLGNATAPSPNLNVQGMTRLPEGGYASNTALAQSVPQLQGFRESQAKVAGIEAETEGTKARTAHQIQATEHARILFPDEQRLLRAQIGATEASTRASNAQARAANAEAGNREQQLRLAANNAVDQQLDIFTRLAGTFGGAYAAKAIWGTNNVPSREVLLKMQTDFMGIVSNVATDPAQVEAFYQERARTTIGTNVGLEPVDQDFIDRLIQVGADTQKPMKPEEVYKAAKEAIGQPNSPISAEDMPKIATYLQIMYPDFKIPPKEKSFLRSLADTLSANARPSAGSPAAEKNAALANTRR